MTKPKNQDQNPLLKKVKTRKTPETHLQREVVKLLTLTRPHCLWFSIPNEHAGRFERMRLSAMGLRPGAADLIFIPPPDPDSFVGFIELKSEKGRQTKTQRAFQADVESLGHRYEVCRSVGAVYDTLTNWGLIEDCSKA